ncbi:hypothetical protein NCS52_00542800 [Fusarium sp. LHS14.1]|nr:hypothetical protein NCS52_00542800 [Fusarium sp. LHS14.1]
MFEAIKHAGNQHQMKRNKSNNLNSPTVENNLVLRRQHFSWPGPQRNRHHASHSRTSHISACSLIGTTTMCLFRVTVTITDLRYRFGIDSPPLWSSPLLRIQFLFAADSPPVYADCTETLDLDGTSAHLTSYGVFQRKGRQVTQQVKEFVWENGHDGRDGHLLND